MLQMWKALPYEDDFSEENIPTKSQFEDMNMFTITADNVIELLKKVTDNTLREKIIQLAASKTSSSSHSIPDDKKVKDDFVYSAPYSLSEVHNRLSSKQTMVVLTILEHFSDSSSKLVILTLL
ncbi:hypothetical protein H5410_050772 [Solanum commersonii]|uniref:Uncharacterized protein n=1 Tax=Solanum commersonii TaxID=4109 RepID=A0A9J5WWE3_SOLCO|nr:hypothetical protein H5410_050772 [Solanum commersonii]